MGVRASQMASIPVTGQLATNRYQPGELADTLVPGSGPRLFKNCASPAWGQGLFGGFVFVAKRVYLQHRAGGALALPYLRAGLKSLWVRIAYGKL